MVLVLASPLFGMLLLMMITPTYAQDPAQACVQFTINGINNGAPICRTDTNEFAAFFPASNPAQVALAHVNFTKDNVPSGTTSNSNPPFIDFKITWDPATVTIDSFAWSGNTSLAVPVPPETNDLECKIDAPGFISRAFWADKEIVVPPGSNDCHFALTPGQSPSVGGEILGIDMTSLFVAGAFANIGWILPFSRIDCSWNSRLCIEKEN